MGWHDVSDLFTIKLDIMAQLNAAGPADKKDQKDKDVQISDDGLKIEGTEIYMGDSTLQTPEEHQEDANTDPEKDDEITLGND
jgi:hypothetical protein